MRPSDRAVWSWQNGASGEAGARQGSQALGVAHLRSGERAGRAVARSRARSGGRLFVRSRILAAEPYSSIAAIHRCFTEHVGARRAQHSRHHVRC